MVDLVSLQEADPERFPFLLESVIHGSASARYSILMAAGDERLDLRQGVTTSNGREVSGAFLDQLDRWFLSELHHLVSSIESPELYLPESHLERLDETKSIQLFPEQRRAVCLNGGRVLIAPDESSSRQGFPRWTAAGTVPASQSHVPLATLSNTQIVHSSAKIEPICPHIRCAGRVVILRSFLNLL